MGNSWQWKQKCEKCVIRRGVAPKSVMFLFLLGAANIFLEVETDTKIFWLNIFALLTTSWFVLAARLALSQWEWEREIAIKRERVKERVCESECERVSEGGWGWDSVSVR